MVRNILTQKKNYIAGISLIELSNNGNRVHIGPTKVIELSICTILTTHSRNTGEFERKIEQNDYRML